MPVLLNMLGYSLAVLTVASIWGFFIIIFVVVPLIVIYKITKDEDPVIEEDS